MPIPTPGTTTEETLTDEDLGFFDDDPLDSVVQDNIDLECIIGPGPPGDENVPENGRPYFVTELEVQLTNGSESDYAVGKVLGDGHGRKPSPNEPDIITIDVDNELMQERQDADGEITRIFTGIIANSSRIKEGFYEFVAFWPGYNEIQNGRTIISFGTPEEEDYEYQGKSYSIPDYSNRSQYTSILADDVAADITRTSGFDYTVTMDEFGYDIGGTTYAKDQQVFVDGTHVPITTEGHDEGLLKRITTASNSVWKIDRFGDFHIGPPIPQEDVADDGRIPTSIASHKIRYFTETSAGLQSPAWRSVVVIGDNVVSQDGWQASAQVSNNPQEFGEPITETRAIDGVSDQLAEPTFEYTNLEINTAEEARHVLDKLKEEIKAQQASGEITVVGHPEVRPGDAVELPNSEDQPFGLERYGVYKVVHRINNQDGFLTKIEVAGQTNAEESLFSEEVGVPDIVEQGVITQEEFEKIRYR